MFARHLNLSLYLDNVFGAALLLGGTALGAGAALDQLPIEAGMFGVIVFGYGKLLCVGAMLRQLEAREVEAFKAGRRSALQVVKG